MISTKNLHFHWNHVWQRQLLKAKHKRSKKHSFCFLLSLMNDNHSMLFLFNVAVSHLIPRRCTKCPIQLAPDSKLDAQRIRQRHNNLLLLHKSDRPSSLWQGRTNRRKIHARRNHVYLCRLGCKPTDGAICAILHLGTTYCHLGFYCSLVFLHVCIWIIASKLFHKCLQSLCWDSCSDSFLLDCHAIRDTFFAYTVLFKLDDKNVVFSYASWKGTMDEVWGQEE